jgi:hypothetical protein
MLWACFYHGLLGKEVARPQASPELYFRLTEEGVGMLKRILPEVWIESDYDP